MNDPARFIPLIVGVLIILTPLIWLIGTYNGLVRIQNFVRESWAGIDTELKRRYDLIPNLVETVKGYAAHERQTLELVIARAQPRGGVGRLAAVAGARRKRIRRRAPAAFRRRRGVSGSQGQPQFPAPAKRIGQHRGPHPGGAAVLQRERARPEHAHPGLPLEHRGGHVQLSRRGVLRDRKRDRARSAAGEPRRHAMNEKKPFLIGRRESPAGTIAFSPPASGGYDGHIIKKSRRDGRSRPVKACHHQGVQNGCHSIDVLFEN